MLMSGVVTLKRRLAPERAAKHSCEEAGAAVRTLIAWAGDDPNREGLVDTPRRAAKAYDKLFSGYRERPDEAL